MSGVNVLTSSPHLAEVSALWAGIGITAVLVVLGASKAAQWVSDNLAAQLERDLLREASSARTDANEGLVAQVERLERARQRHFENPQIAWRGHYRLRTRALH